MTLGSSQYGHAKQKLRPCFYLGNNFSVVECCAVILALRSARRCGAAGKCRWGFRSDRRGSARPHTGSFAGRASCADWKAVALLL